MLEIFFYLQSNLIGWYILKIQLILKKKSINEEMKALVLISKFYSLQLNAIADVEIVYINLIFGFQLNV